MGLATGLLGSLEQGRHCSLGHWSLRAVGWLGQGVGSEGVPVPLCPPPGGEALSAVLVSLGPMEPRRWQVETGGLRPGLSALPTLWAMQVAHWPPEPQCPHLPVAAELKELYVGLGRAEVALGQVMVAPLWLTRLLVNLTQAAMDVDSNLQSVVPRKGWMRLSSVANHDLSLDPTPAPLSYGQGGRACTRKGHFPPLRPSQLLESSVQTHWQTPGA